MADTGRKWEFYQDNAGLWRWRCQATNGNLVGASAHGYKNKHDCVVNARSWGYTG